MTTATVPLESLRIGQRFRLGEKRGKLLALHTGSAVVEIRGPRIKQFRTADGKQVTIGGNRTRTTWSRLTSVEIETRRHGQSSSVVGSGV